MQSDGERVEVIVAREDWRELMLNPHTYHALEIFNKGQLHEAFGDDYHEHVVRVEIRLVGKLDEASS